MKRNPSFPRPACFEKAVTSHGATLTGVYRTVRQGSVIPPQAHRAWLLTLTALLMAFHTQGYAEESAEAGVTVPERKPVPAAKTDCALNERNVKEVVEAKPEVVLAIVEAQVIAHPGCACEVVKAAIIGSKASSQQVARIVETAIMAAPEHMRLISQCALAVAPDALPHVQAVLAKMDPAAGREYESDAAKDSKDAKEVVDPATSPSEFFGPAVPPNDFFPRIPPATDISPPQADDERFPQ